MNDTGWIETMFRELDSGGVPALFPYLHEDVTFRFASYPAGRGRQAFAQVWAAMSGDIESLCHDLLDVWEVDGAAICRGNVTYGLKDGRTVTVPFANVLYRRDGLISDYLIYVDASEVFGAAG